MTQLKKEVSGARIKKVDPFRKINIEINSLTNSWHKHYYCSRMHQIGSSVESERNMKLNKRKRLSMTTIFENYASGRKKLQMLST
jgi:hypothetical protein